MSRIREVWRVFAALTKPRKCIQDRTAWNLDSIECKISSSFLQDSRRPEAASRVGKVKLKIYPTPLAAETRKASNADAVFEPSAAGSNAISGPYFVISTEHTGTGFSWSANGFKCAMTNFKNVYSSIAIQPFKITTSKSLLTWSTYNVRPQFEGPGVGRGINTNSIGPG